MDEDASTMGEDAAPFSVNLAAIPDDNAATDRANSVSSINAIAAPTLLFMDEPSMDEARSKSVAILPSMDGLAALPDLVSSAGIMPFMDEGAATDHVSSAPSMLANAGIPPSMDAKAAPPRPRVQH